MSSESADTQLLEMLGAAIETAVNGVAKTGFVLTSSLLTTCIEYAVSFINPLMVNCDPPDSAIFLPST
jgi:hypothetical protein